MLGNTLVTKQTWESGIKCNAVYVVEKVKVVNEKYLSITLDRKHQSPVFLGSAEWGVNIEDTAHNNPDAIKILPVNVKTGLTLEAASKYAVDLGYKWDQVKQAAEIFMNIYSVFMKKDCLMIEVNPLATVVNPNTWKEEVMVIDSKVSVDDNAAFR